MKRRLLPLIVCTIVLTLVPSAQAEGTGSPLRVWVPSAYTKAMTLQHMQPFLQQLQQRLHRPTKLSVYTDLNLLLQHCIVDEVDHALLDQSHAQAVMEYCRFIPLAKAEQPIFLYSTRHSGIHRLTELRRIGIHSPTSGAELIRKELDPKGVRYKLVSYANLLGALSDLLENRIDALVSLQGTVSNLDKRLLTKLRTLYRFKTPHTAYFLVSPQLQQQEIADIRALYLQDNPVMNRIFLEQFGLGRFTAPNNRERQLFSAKQGENSGYKSTR